MSGDEFEVIVVFIAGFGLGCTLFWYGFQIRMKKRFIENIPTSKTRSIALGLVEVHGKAQGMGELLKSPFNRTDCVFFRFEVQERRTSGKSSRWVTIKEHESSKRFYLEDGTGKILIAPQKAELHLNRDRDFSMHIGSSDQEEVFKEGLRRVGINPKGFLGLGDRPLRCDETYIEPGDAIYVMGTAMDNPAVRGAAVGVDNLYIGKGEQFFCISDKSEKDLLESLTWRMLGSIWGGPILAIGSLFFLIKYYS